MTDRVKVYSKDGDCVSVYAIDAAELVKSGEYSYSPRPPETMLEKFVESVADVVMPLDDESTDESDEVKDVPVKRKGRPKKKED